MIIMVCAYNYHHHNLWYIYMVLFSHAIFKPCTNQTAIMVMSMRINYVDEAEREAVYEQKWEHDILGL